MTSSLRSRGSRCPAPAEVNRAIRDLMDRPDDGRRAEEYARLLLLWAEANAARDRWGTAA
ncbi:hypothetical protein ABZX75_17760 [Streptomyces sp. NPDC003038]|uniref:hypothetical protein n=1 Tax=unclassified Streptomyces TaxID=2593676 RepID=UPI0033B8BEA7